MTQPISTFQDILDALDQNPELRKEFNRRMLGIIRSDPELRRELLTEELLEMPVRLTRLESDMAEVKADVADLKAGETRLEESQSRLKSVTPT